ncbi:Protein kinase domain [Sesbania bispinosa]|nr:Protein kinase domain [Sesbania bispinosa]
MASDPVSAAPSSSTNQSICPVSMNYVLTVSWNHSTCLNFQPLPSKQDTSTTTCCKTLLNLFGIALADNLKKTSLFHLPNISTSISCLEDYQSKLTSLLLPNNLVSSCFDPLQFVISPNICANIQTKQDWINRVGPSNTALDTACEPDLTDFARCQYCVNEGYNVQQMVARIDGLIWFKFEDLVKATNNFSPQNFIGRGGSGSVYKGILPDGKMVAVKRIEESDYQGDAEFYREVGIVSSLKHRNLVPLRGCCVVVEHESAEYTGRDIKATNILLDADESSTRNIMERFLLVGILSSHVIAASRPTILDALRMLEGDIEVPPIPDRPMSLGHYMFPSGDSFGMNTEFGFEGLSRFENPSLKNWTRTN